MSSTIIVRCVCGEPIDQTPTTYPIRWRHSVTDGAHRAPGETATDQPGMATPDVPRLYRDTIDALDPTYELVYAARATG